MRGPGPEVACQASPGAPFPTTRCRPAVWSGSRPANRTFAIPRPPAGAHAARGSAIPSLTRWLLLTRRSRRRDPARTPASASCEQPQTALTSSRRAQTRRLCYRAAASSLSRRVPAGQLTDLPDAHAPLRDPRRLSERGSLDGRLVDGQGRSRHQGVQPAPRLGRTTSSRRCRASRSSAPCASAPASRAP